MVRLDRDTCQLYMSNRTVQCEFQNMIYKHGGGVSSKGAIVLGEGHRKG